METTREAHLEVLRFWFGELDEHGLCSQETSSRWWKKDPQLDSEISSRFGWLHACLNTVNRRDQRPAFVSGADGLLAAILVLDQFSRNMFRGTAGMFASDSLAQQFSLELIGLSLDRSMPVPYAVFSYMPLMHSEDLGDQERCVVLFRELAERSQGEAKKTVLQNVDFAERHRDIVARFGRFPHRNQMLGRESSETELEFLKQPGSSF